MPSDHAQNGENVTLPVVVSNAMSADDANALYGDRFGVDWTYPDPPTITVPLPELRRALAAIDIAATNDGELLSGPQERAVMALRRTIRDAGHFCLHLPITECPVCTPHIGRRRSAQSVPRTAELRLTMPSDLTTAALAKFLKREAESWRENFGQEWVELRLAGEAIERHLVLVDAVRQAIADLDAEHQPQWASDEMKAKGKDPLGCRMCWPKDGVWPCYMRSVADDLRAALEATQ